MTDLSLVKSCMRAYQVNNTSILVACEESQAVCIAFRERGFNAYSCDILPCSGDHPEWHIQEDLGFVLEGDCLFQTADGILHRQIGPWDMVIAFPPCTYLTCAGNRWFNCEKYGNKALDREQYREEAAEFFMRIANCNSPHIAIENPVGVMSTRYRKPDQIIQPYYFGDPFEKRTCLWLHNLPLLISTDIVDIPPRQVLSSGRTMPMWYSNASGDRSRIRSITFPGIAKAMAEQWGDFLMKEVNNYE